MMKNWLLAMAILVGGVCTSTADMIEFSAPFGPMPAAMLHPPVMLPQFDPALGTLISVTIELDAATHDGVIVWDNEAEIPTEVLLGIGAEVTATAPSALVIVVTPMQMDNHPAIMPDDDGAPDFVGADSFGVSSLYGSDLDSNTITIDLDPYIGLGTFATGISSQVENMLSTSGGFGPTESTPGTVDGTVKVIYEYEVPEPATLGLLILGSLAAIRRH